MERKRLELVIFSVFFLVLAVMIFFVFQPFLRILVLGVVLSILFHPLSERLLKIFHNRKTLVSLLLVGVALIFIIIPILFFALQLLGQAQEFFALSHAGQGQYLHTIQQNIDILVRNIIPGFSFSISDTVDNVLTFFSDNLGVLLSKTTYVFFETFFLLFTLFFLLRDGEKMLHSFISLSPFGGEQNKEIIHSVDRTITAVVRGTLFVGLIRLLLLTGAFYLLGIPGALLWGSIGGVIAAVPGLGTPLVIIPTVIYLLLFNSPISAIGMVLFGILIVFFIDNMLSAFYFGKGLDVPSIFVLFSILGGVMFFGPLGFIFGPIVLSLFVSAIDMYKILVLQKP